MKAKIILDSVNENGIRLTTMQLEYPRFIHAEFMTHRVFSRNASSSRAIPVYKMLKQVWSAPAMPIHWGNNQPGMQARNELLGIKKWMAKKLWIAAGRSACIFAYLSMKVGLHKQVANRILEPWQIIHVVVTATEWDNFFYLRDHPDAQPEIKELAHRMKIAMDTSKPKMLTSGEWHLPYVFEYEHNIYITEVLRKLSAARCARVSYKLHDGSKTDVTKDIDLHDKLTQAEPPHLSPVEHQAEARSELDFFGNFRGWKQYRKYLEESE